LAPVSCALVLALAAGRSTAADTIVLKDGRRIDARSAWLEGAEIRYRTAQGTLFAVPRSLVASVLSESGKAALADPDLDRSAERLAAGDATEALRLARLALFRQPSSTSGLQALAAAQLALGDARRASESAQEALALDPRNAYSHELLADALAELADFVGAREQYRMSLELDPQPRVQQKLATVFASAASSSSARLQIRYDGAADEPLGLAVLRVLDQAWAEYQKRFGFAPGQAVTVVLQTETSFRDTTRAPGWAAAWNDGTIRVPVAGLKAPTAGLVRVLRHELAHSFVAARAGRTCPTWLHEGIAQWLEGRDAQREDAELVELAARRPLPRLESLESPFVGLSEAEATTAYAESLSVVAYILKLRGEAGLRRLLEALGEGRPAAEALPVALALSYGELQRAWERQLLVERPRSRPVSRILSPPPGTEVPLGG
jgi:tetratricopeptide (TPR) repeat protein